MALSRLSKIWMFISFLIHFLTNAQDPDCSTGLPSNSLCCAAFCDVCAGSGCGSQGSTNCCGSNIVNSGKYCHQFDPPCMMIPATPSPLIISIGAQQIYQSVFDDPSDIAEWTIANPDRVEWLQPSSSCVGLFDEYCAKIFGQGSIYRTISTSGYHDIEVFIDIGASDMESGEWCYMEYGTSSTQSIYNNLLRETGKIIDLQISIPDTDDFNDDASFEIMLGNSGSGGGDICLFDNLRVYGIPYTSNPTIVPTSAPTERPTTNPSQSPTPNPTIVPTSAPTERPTNKPTNDPIESPTLPPTIENTVTTNIEEQLQDAFSVNLMILLISGGVTICLILVILILMKCYNYKTRKSVSDTSNEKDIGRGVEMSRMMSIASTSSMYEQTGSTGVTGMTGVTSGNVTGEAQTKRIVGLVTWLSNLKLMEYYDTFEDNGFSDGKELNIALSKITNEDLKEMGIKLAHRKLILNRIQMDQNNKNEWNPMEMKENVAMNMLPTPPPVPGMNLLNQDKEGEGEVQVTTEKFDEDSSASSMFETPNIKNHQTDDGNRTKEDSGDI